MSNATQSDKPGKLICIGTGICTTEQITVSAIKHLENADVVYGVMPNTSIDNWIQGINPSYISMQSFYAHGKSRHQTYMEMARTMLHEVRAGKYVCCALYGHPGVIANIGHLTVGLAKQEGLEAKMEPGISAEDCIFADLGIDPGYSGCQNYEATHLLFYKHIVDPYALLILWHICLAGEHTLRKFKTTKSNLQITVEFLNKWYPLEHQVIIYEAPFLSTETARIDRIPLKDLPEAQLNSHSTLIITPIKLQAEYNHEMLAKLGLTAADLG